jgi:hypothetical protein
MRPIPNLRRGPARKTGLEQKLAKTAKILRAKTLIALRDLGVEDRFPSRKTDFEQKITKTAKILSDKSSLRSDTVRARGLPFALINPVGRWVAVPLRCALALTLFRAIPSPQCLTHPADCARPVPVSS